METKTKIIDLTHLLTNNITVYPGTLSPEFEQANTIKKDGFAELTMKMCSHTGTHMDAPCHILPNTKSLDQYSVDKFIGKAFVINCSHEDSINLELLQSHEKEISQVDFLLFYTGWQNKWNTPNYFDVFPTLTIEALEWLIKFELKAVGFDSISVDKISDQSLPNHHILLENEVLIVENLTNLDQILNTIFEFHCIPLKIENADGSPIRAFAKLFD